jgi:hypothetical protein
MSTISTQLRAFKDPTKDELTALFFAIPAPGSGLSGEVGSASYVSEKAAADGRAEEEVERMEINATLSVGPEVEEESYVSCCYIVQNRPYRSVCCLSLHTLTH